MADTQKKFDDIIRKIALVVKLVNEEVDDEPIESEVNELNDEISDLTCDIIDEKNDFVELKDLKTYIIDVIGKNYFVDKREISYLYDSVYDVYKDMNNVLEEELQTGLGMQQQLPTNSKYHNGIFDIYNNDEEEKKDMDKRLEEKRIDEEDRINALAEFLGLDEEEKEEIEVDRYNDKLLTYDGDEYLVVDDDEADEEFEDYQRALWDDMGIESFSESFQDWIMGNAIDSSWFEDAMDESNRFYAEDIKDESSREYANRLVEECYDYGLIDDDDFEKDEDGEPNYEECTKDEDDLIDMLVDYMREDDAIRWYRDTFGDDDFKNVVIDKNLVNFDEVINEVKSWDGRGCLATYDGKENEEGDFFIYRTN